jgi:exopolyphosphatase/guanosine-5'-triphosphate,3'-diphosphate pyrophosphatase
MKSPPIQPAAGASGPGVPPDANGPVAAVDLGSNSFHLVVARFAGGTVTIDDRYAEMVRLAEGVTDAGEVVPKVADRALACLHRIRERINALPPGAVRVVGTNALRAIGPHGAFLRSAEAALGRPINIISGMEEARLIYAGVAHDLEVGGRRLVMDIGGGSTELIVGDGLEPLYMESVDMGCVRVTRAHFADGNLSAERMARAVVDCKRRLRPVSAAFRDLGWDEAVGSSGTFRALDRVTREAGWSPDGITRKGLTQLAERIAGAGSIAKLRIAGVSPERAASLPGGVAVALALVEGLEIRRVATAQGAMREGVLYDLAGRAQKADIRTHSVADLARRYHVDAAQAARVAATALELLEEVREAWDLADPEWARFLEWAARLHEVGRDIAHSGYHKHGAYVAANADLPGFSRQEQGALAWLIRAHRRKFPAAQLVTDLPERWRQPARRLAVLLRMSVILHRGRGAEPLPEVALSGDTDRLDLRFPEGWLARHPLTRGDLEAEAAVLAPLGRLGFH